MPDGLEPKQVSTHAIEIVSVIEDRSEPSEIEPGADCANANVKNAATERKIAMGFMRSEDG